MTNDLRNIFASIKKVSFNRSNFLSDLNNCYSYEEVLNEFSIITKIFKDKGVLFDQFILLYVDNTINSAVLLLWCLYNKIGFVLGSKNYLKKSASFNFVPSYCKYVVSVEPSEDNKSLKSLALDIQVLINEQFMLNKHLQSKGKIIVQTSGSTNTAKFVQHSSENLIKNSYNIAAYLKYTEGDRILIPVSISHMYGLGVGLLPGIISGAKICMINNTNIIKYITKEKEFQPSISILTPGLCEMLLKLPRSYNGFRFSTIGGERISSSNQEKYEKKYGKLVNLYGSSEMGVIAGTNPNKGIDHANNLLTPVPGVKVHFEKLHSSENQFVIFCKSEFGFINYLDSKGNAASQNFHKSYFCTNDIVKKSSKDSFNIVDRVGNGVNRDGILVSCTEIETTIEKEFPEIEKVIVLVDKSVLEYRGKKLIAFCKIKQKVSIAALDIKSKAQKRIIKHLLADEYILIEDFPLLPNFKINRKQLLKNYKEIVQKNNNKKSDD